MSEEVKTTEYKKLIIGIVVVATIVTLLFVPMIPVKEPYKLTGEFSRQCRYEVVSATLKEEFELSGRGAYYASIIVVKNIDAHGGTFKVKHNLYDINGLYETKITSEYLSAGETKTFRAEFDTQWLQDARGEYSISVPTVIDKIVVTKHKTVYKSIIELLLYG